MRRSKDTSVCRLHSCITSGAIKDKKLGDVAKMIRDGFLNVAKSPAPRDVPYELDISSVTNPRTFSSP